MGNGNILIIISPLKLFYVLKKKYIKFSNNYIDILLGNHLFIKNGKTVQNSIGKAISIRSGFYVDKKKSLNKIRFLFSDLDSEQSLRGKLELMPGNTLIWQVANLEGVRVDFKTTISDDYNIYVPQHLILKKVK